MKDEAQLTEKRLRTSGLKFKITSGDNYEGYLSDYDPREIDFIHSKLFDPNYDQNKPEKVLDQIRYRSDLILEAREILKSTKYCGLEIIIDEMVNWEVLAILQEKFNSAEKWTKLERIIADVAVFYMGGESFDTTSSDPNYRRAKGQLDNMIEALFTKFGYVEEENYIKFVNLALDNIIIKSEPKVLEFRRNLEQDAMNTFESIRTSDRYIQSLQKRGRDVIKEFFEFSDVWGLDELADFLMREFNYDYSDSLRNLKQMVLSKEPVSFEFLAGLFQNVMEAFRSSRFDINEDTFIYAIKKYNPIFSLFLDQYYQDHSETERLSYLLKYEKGFQEYYEWNQILYESWQGDIDKIKDMNQYSTGRFGASWSTATDVQIELLLDLWDGRDALTGELLRDENGNLLTGVLRHHYKILYVIGGRVYFIKYDCRLSALVPLSINSHGVVNTFANADEHAKNFERVMNKLMRGEWATPDWWLQYPGGAENIESFEENLLRLGYVKPNNLDR